MPRVSAAHLASRRKHILTAATRLFARNGFHATSMQDVIAEAGMSVGAVYRYFKSKEELRRAIAEQNLAEMGGALDELISREPAPTIPEAMAAALDMLAPRLTEYGQGAIALQIWAESVRDPELHEFVNRVFDRLRGGFVTVVRRARQAGHLSADVDVESLGVALFSLLPGYVVQNVLTGQPDHATMRAGVHALLITATQGNQQAPA